MSSDRTDTTKKRGRGRPPKRRRVVVEDPIVEDEEALDSMADDKDSSEDDVRTRPSRARRIDATEQNGSSDQAVTVPSNPDPTRDGSDPSIPTDQISLLVSAINKASTASKLAMEQQLAEFRVEMRRDQQDAAVKIARKVKRGKKVEFKRKGNEDQFRFNEQLDDKLDEAEGTLESLPEPRELPGKIRSPIRRAKEALKEGREALNNRQKMIRIADRSEFGWELVKEYAEDELADDTDDEKRIRRAEKEAEKRIASRKKVAAGKNKRSFRSAFPHPTSRQPGQQQFYEPRVPFKVGDSGAGSRSRGPKSGPLGPCHMCHEYGHLQYSCPKRTTNNKYPLMYCSSSSDEATLHDSVNGGDPILLNDSLKDQRVIPALVLKVA